MCSSDLFYPGCGAAQPVTPDYNFYTDPEEPHWKSVGELKAGYGLLGGVSTNIPKEDVKWQSTHDWLVSSTRASVPSGNCEVASTPA